MLRYKRQGRSVGRVTKRALYQYMWFYVTLMLVWSWWLTYHTTINQWDWRKRTCSFWHDELRYHFWNDGSRYRFWNDMLRYGVFGNFISFEMMGHVITFEMTCYVKAFLATLSLLKQWVTLSLLTWHVTLRPLRSLGRYVRTPVRSEVNL